MIEDVVRLDMVADIGPHPRVSGFTSWVAVVAVESPRFGNNIGVMSELRTTHPRSGPDAVKSWHDHPETSLAACG